MALTSWYSFFMEPVLPQTVCGYPAMAVVVAEGPPVVVDAPAAPGEKGIIKHKDGLHGLNLNRGDRL